MSLVMIITMAATDAAHAGPQGITLDMAALGHGVRVFAAVVSILIGLFFMFAGTLGVLRLPDFYTRIHAAGMTDTLGAEMILLGLMIQGGFSQMTLKLLFVAFFLLLTGPTSTHAVANAAYHVGLRPQLGRYKVKSVDDIRNGTAGDATKVEGQS